MLGDFEHQAVAAVLGLERVENRRQVASNCTSTTAPMTWVNATDLVGAVAIELSPSIRILDTASTGCA
jgi:hypothetical protein